MRYCYECEITEKSTGNFMSNGYAIFAEATPDHQTHGVFLFSNLRRVGEAFHATRVRNGIPDEVPEFRGIPLKLELTIGEVDSFIFLDQMDEGDRRDLMADLADYSLGL